MHAGETEDFSKGCRYTLKYGFSEFADLREKFDDLFLCLKELKRNSDSISENIFDAFDNYKDNYDDILSVIE